MERFHQSVRTPCYLFSPERCHVYGRDVWMDTHCGRFCGRYETKVKDFNFGSLIRTDATKEYSETNTIFGRFQSLSIAFVLTCNCHSDADAVLRHRGGYTLSG